MTDPLIQDQESWQLTDGTIGLITVVIPAYNRLDLILETLNSIENQSYSPLECIIVDDGSPENLSPQIERWVDMHPTSNISWKVYRQENQGACGARNYGARKSNGEFVLFLDSDDKLEPTAIEKAKEAAESHNSRIAYFQVQVTYSDLSPKANLIYGSPKSKGSNYYMDYSWHTIGALYHKSLLQEVGPWNESVSGNDDWEFQVRAKLKETNPVFINEVLGYYRDHDDQRLSVKTYNVGWMTDLIGVLNSIIGQLRNAGRLDNLLRNRLAKRALIHAIECGGFGDIERKTTFCQIADGLHPPSILIRFLIIMVNALPSQSILKVLYVCYTKTR